MSSSLSLVKESKTLVIGGTGGLGRQIARNLASDGSQVTVVGQTFRDEGISNLSFIKSDLSSIRTAQELGTQLAQNQFDVVLFTTGIIASRERQETPEGFERDLAVSYLNRLAIIDSLFSDKSSFFSNAAKSELAKPRVFVMGFPGNNQSGNLSDINQEKSYGVMGAHSNTVAGNEALVHYFAKKEPRVDIFGLNPGIVKTDIRKNLWGDSGIMKYVGGVMEFFIGFFNETPEQYASRITPLLYKPGIKSGSLFNNKGDVIPASKEFDFDYSLKWIEASRALIKEKLGI